MEPAWYRLRHGKEDGPFPYAVVKVMAKRGDLLVTDQLREGMTGEWRQAADFPDLFVTVEPRSAFSDPSSLNGLTMALGIEPVGPANDPLLGRDIGGVTIVRLIAEGGMGRVYEGLQEKPKRQVAVKIMRPGFVSREVSQRFGMELEILGRLRHPYIAQIYSAGMCDVVGSQVPFFVMEYIPDALPITRFAKDRMLGVGSRLELFRKVCEAIAHGHEKGIVHRDLKPSNILVEPSGIPKIIDFGIARSVGDTTETMTALTELGQLIGTLQYMSPEQIEADPKAVDQRTDVYALGVILYELLTGTRPYELSSRQIFEAAQIVRKQKPISPRKLNSKLSHDIVKVTGICLQKNRQRRYANAAELASAVGLCLANTSIPSRSERMRDKTWRSGSRQASPVYALAVMALTAITVAAAGYRVIRSIFAPTGLQPNQPAPAIAPFDATQARMYQDAWAKHLGIEVETTNSIGATLVVIPPGRFIMGDETNAHEVTLTKPFLIGETEVTQRQWRQVMQNEPWKGQKYSIQGDDVAATFVSWDDARSFCEKLTNQERQSGQLTADQEYRLPTEAEWEFACRAGTVSKYSFGDDEAVLGDHAWFGGGWEGRWGTGQPIPGGNTALQPHAQIVKLKRPNSFGLYDMHGNVVCWCSDWKGNHSLTAAVDPQGPGNGVTRSVRGGSWYELPVSCQSSSRGGGFPWVRSWHVGFRLVLSLSGRGQPNPESQLGEASRADRATASIPPLGPEEQAEPSATAQQTLARPPIENSVGMKLKLIPPGTFMMGVEDGQADEKPVREVRITKPFYLGVTEVTNAQWRAVMGGEPPSYWRDDDRPLETVNCNDAIAFCEKLSGMPEEQKAGRVYRLPTEAEWEYACRAGTTTRWSCGNDDAKLVDFAWFIRNAGGRTHPVGTKKPNPWGFHDMHGNVWEWCAGWYKPNPGEVVTDPASVALGSSGFHRGGGWNGNPGHCRSANRSRNDPSFRDRGLGFRLLALSPLESTPVPQERGKENEQSPARRESVDALRMLQQKITLVFDKDTLEKTIQMISKQIGVPMEILDRDLQLEGITKNQTLGLDETDKTVEAVLRVVLAIANSDGKLVYVVRKKDGTESIEITTRAAAKKRGDELPAGQ